VSPPAKKVTKTAMTRIETALRAQALAYPEVTEDFPWGHRALKVKGKAFLFLALDDDGLSFSVKLPASSASALALPFVEPTRYGLGQHGWVTARLAHGADAPLEMFQGWVEESYRAIAPKKLVLELDA
jgi:predicted DNA-binding protein (MmcQ/YjbR family)